MDNADYILNTEPIEVVINRNFYENFIRKAEKFKLSQNATFKDK